MGQLAPIRNPNPGTLRQVEDVVRQGFDGVFARQGSRRGAWSPLLPTTQRDRMRRGYLPTRPILIRSGSLRNSFVNRGHFYATRRLSIQPTGWRLYVGSRHPIAGFHNDGTRKMVARVITDLHEDSRRRIESELAQWAHRQLQ